MHSASLTVTMIAVSIGCVTSAFAEPKSDALSQQDRNFLIEAALSNMAEIQFAQVAKEKSRDNAVQAFAQQILEDHRQAGDQLRQIAQNKEFKLPENVSAVDQTRLKALKALSGSTFDYRYVGGQEEAHENAVQLFEEELANGRDADLQRFARDNLPTLLDHLMSAKIISYELARSNPRLVQGGLMLKNESAHSTVLPPSSSNGAAE